MAKKTTVRLSQEQEAQKAALIDELKKGKESAPVKNFDAKKHLKELNEKYR